MTGKQVYLHKSSPKIAIYRKLSSHSDRRHVRVCFFLVEGDNSAIFMLSNVPWLVASGKKGYAVNDTIHFYGGCEGMRQNYGWPGAGAGIGF
jgi:hypothetical protein